MSIKFEDLQYEEMLLQSQRKNKLQQKKLLKQVPLLLHQKSRLEKNQMVSNINFIQTLKLDCMAQIIDNSEFWNFVQQTYSDFDMDRDSFVKLMAAQVIDHWQSAI